MGKHCGYHTDGTSYRLAPTWIDRFEAVQAEGAAIKQLLDWTTEHATARLEAVMKRKALMWRDVMDDLGLPASPSGPQWEYLSGVISPVAPKSRATKGRKKK